MTHRLTGGPLDGADVEGPPTDTESGEPRRILVEGQDGWYAPTLSGYVWVDACECGTALSDHPSLPQPLPWSHGRPCAKTAVERGYGWDGRPAVEHKRGSRWRPS